MGWAWEIPVKAVLWNDPRNMRLPLGRLAPPLTPHHPPTPSASPTTWSGRHHYAKASSTNTSVFLGRIWRRVYSIQVLLILVFRFLELGWYVTSLLTWTCEFFWSDGILSYFAKSNKKYSTCHLSAPVANYRITLSYQLQLQDSCYKLILSQILFSFPKIPPDFVVIYLDLIFSQDWTARFIPRSFPDVSERNWEIRCRNI